MVNDVISLYLNDILKRNGISPKRTKLIRHSLKHKRCKVAWNNFIDDYQFKVRILYNCDYILLYKEPGTSAKFIGAVGAGIPITELLCQKDSVPKCL